MSFYFSCRLCFYLADKEVLATLLCNIIFMFLLFWIPIAWIVVCFWRCIWQSSTYHCTQIHFWWCTTWAKLRFHVCSMRMWQKHIRTNRGPLSDPLCHLSVCSHHGHMETRPCFHDFPFFVALTFTYCILLIWNLSLSNYCVSLIPRYNHRP